MEVYRVADTELHGVFGERIFIWKRGGKLAALSWGGFQSRHPAVTRLFEVADERHGLAEFGPLTINSSDRPCNTDPACLCLSFSEADGFLDIAIPDFVFDSWPETGIADYTETVAEVARAGTEPAEQPHCGWIGNAGLHPHREQLLELSRLHPDLIEAIGIDWAANDRIPSPVTNGETVPAAFLTIPQQIRRWSYVIDVEGNGYSGRLKVLLHAGRPVFIQERPWREWYWDELRPMENFIPVRPDLSDLIERLKWARSNRQEAEAIGRAGQRLALSRLTRDAALSQLALTMARLAQEQGDASYAQPHQRALLDPVLESLGAFT